MNNNFRVPTSLRGSFGKSGNGGYEPTPRTPAFRNLSLGAMPLEKEELEGGSAPYSTVRRQSQSTSSDDKPPATAAPNKEKVSTAPPRRGLFSRGDSLSSAPARFWSTSSDTRPSYRSHSQPDLLKSQNPQAFLEVMLKERGYDIFHSGHGLSERSHSIATSVFSYTLFESDTGTAKRSISRKSIGRNSGNFGVWCIAQCL